MERNSNDQRLAVNNFPTKYYKDMSDIKGALGRQGEKLAELVTKAILLENALKHHEEMDRKDFTTIRREQDKMYKEFGARLQSIESTIEKLATTVGGLGSQNAYTKGFYAAIGAVLAIGIGAVVTIVAALISG